MMKCLIVPMQQSSAPAIRRLRSELALLRGTWPGFEADLHRMGFTALAEFRGRDPDLLATQYCALTGRPADPLLSSCFAALVRFAETGEPRPYWRILRTRSAHEVETISAAAKG
jgi:Pathogenicity locus